MPDIKIVKIKLRRGSEIQRKLVTFDQGELGYVTDTKRVFVGDGSTTGGTVVGSRFFTPITSNKVGLAAYAGDVVVENNLMYQLTGTDATVLSSWKLISPVIDDQTLQVTPSTNVLRIKPDGVGIAQLGNITFAQGAIVMNNTQGLSANVDNTTIVVNGANQLALSTVYASSIIGQINNTQIDTTTVAGSALQGTASGKLNVVVDNSSIVISSNQLTVGAIDASKVASGTFGAERISSAALGDGLQGGNGNQINTKLNAASMGYEGGAITLATLYNAAKIPLSSNDVTFKGFTANYIAASAAATLNSSLSTISINIANAGSGYSFVPTISVQPPALSAGFFAASATAVMNGGVLSAITLTSAGSGYNFVPQVVIDAPAHNETLYQVTTATTTGGVSVTAQTFNLSSAGFVMINFGSAMGGYYAVPIFRVPAELQNLTIATVTV